MTNSWVAFSDLLFLSVCRLILKFFFKWVYWKFVDVVFEPPMDFLHSLYVLALSFQMALPLTKLSFKNQIDFILSLYIWICAIFYVQRSGFGFSITIIGKWLKIKMLGAILVNINVIRFLNTQNMKTVYQLEVGFLLRVLNWLISAQEQSLVKFKKTCFVQVQSPLRNFLFRFFERILQ